MTVTECTQTSFHFATESRREVVARFDGGTIPTEAGGVLLYKTEENTGRAAIRTPARLALTAAKAELRSVTMETLEASHCFLHPHH